MDIRKSKNFAKVVQHSGAAERVAEDTRKNSRFYDPKKKRYEYDDPEEEIADVLARNATGVMKCLNIISKRRRRVLHSGAKLSVRPMIGVILNACRMSVGPMHGSMVVKHATP